MANIFKQQNDVKQHPNRNNFDLSFQNHLTMKMGTLYPVFCKPVVPGDSFKIDSMFGLKFMPMVFPVQSRMRAHMHFFYVRNKNLWDRWQDWISGLKDSNDHVVPPYISQNSNFFATNSLSDYLGVPTTMVGLDSISTRLDLQTYGVIGSSPSVIERYIDARVVSATSINNLPLSVCPSLGSFSTAPTTGTSFFMSVDITRDNLPKLANGIKFQGYLNDEMYPVTGNTALASFKFLSIAIYGQVPTAVGSTIDWYRPVTPVSASYNTSTYKFSFSDAPSSSGGTSVATLQSQMEYAVEHNIPVRLLFSADLSAQTAARSWSNYLLGQVTEPRVNVLTASFVFDVQAETVTELSQQTTNVFSDTSHGVRISALPYRAYESIYNAYYRNSHGVDPFRINGSIEYNKYNTTIDGGADTTPYKLEQRNYELDFMTSCLPSPQAGPAPIVGMSALGQITIEDENGITTAQATLDNDGNVTKVAITSPLASVDHARTLMNMASVGMNINDFRQCNALQRHLEQTLRSGYRYIDFIAGHFGKSPEYRELDMPEFIGGFSRDVVVSQILQSTDTEPICDALGIDGQGSPLGAFAGNANAFGESVHSINHYCDDYGYIIGILSVVPTPAYSQLLPKHFTYMNRLDYYFPEFAQIGMQPVTYKEVCPAQRYVESNGDLTDTFGYQRPNYDLISSIDEVHGNFRTDLRDFLINRRFSVSPELSPAFIKISPDDTNDIFANRTPSDDTIIGQVVFKVYAKRPIPRVVIPSLGR